jgi:hypothetical protein
MINAQQQARNFTARKLLFGAARFMSDSRIFSGRAFVSKRCSFALSADMVEFAPAPGATHDSTASRCIAVGGTVPVQIGLRVPALFATFATDAVHPHMALFAAIMTDTVLPAVRPVGMPSAALADDLTVHGRKVVLFIANLAAGPAKASDPHMPLVARMPAAAAFAAVPLVMHQAMEVHVFSPRTRFEPQSHSPLFGTPGIAQAIGGRQTHP